MTAAKGHVRSEYQNRQWCGFLDIYCRPPGFTVMPPGKYLAGGLQSGCTANLTGEQYKFTEWQML